MTFNQFMFISSWCSCLSHLERCKSFIHILHGFFGSCLPFNSCSYFVLDLFSLASSYSFLDVVFVVVTSSKSFNYNSFQCNTLPLVQTVGFLLRPFWCWSLPFPSRITIFFHCQVLDCRISVYFIILQNHVVICFLVKSSILLFWENVSTLINPSYILSS